MIRKIKLVSCLLFAWFGIVSVKAQNNVTPQNALFHYLGIKDSIYKWKIVDSFKLTRATGYRLLLTSQKWQNLVWNHELIIIVPLQLQHADALLFISGGSIKDDVPRWSSDSDKIIQNLSGIAVHNKSCVAMVRQVPNEPLFGGLVEDQIISYTLHKFQQTHDYTLPLLFPMVKSAVKAMTAVQEFTASHAAVRVEKFVVSGLSKRGWTTWLTGAGDARVEAIAPMVIDVLNMPISLDYQIKTWKDYSIEIQDYVNLGIPQQSASEEGRKLLAMVDPYSYRDRLTMPKMIFMGGNDPYWVIDNVKNYYDSLKGINLLQYVPNAAHNLGTGEQAFNALDAFFACTIHGGSYNPLSWKTSRENNKLKVTVTTNNKALCVKLWEANSNDADIRNNVWLFKDISYKPGTDSFSVAEDVPQKGYRAFFVAVTYPCPWGGTYDQMTRAFVMDTLGLVDDRDKGHLSATLSRLASPDRKHILVAAHRGEHHQAPENSIEAIQQGIEAGVDIVEIDVHVSRDGVPFLMHDKTIDRTTTGRGEAESFTWDELSKFYLKHAGSITPCHIPTLKAALETAKGKIVLDLDLKTDKMNNVLNVIKEVGYSDNLLFFDDDYKNLKITRTAGAAFKLMPRAHSYTQADSAIRLFKPTVVHIDTSFYNDSVLNLIYTGKASAWINLLGDMDDYLLTGSNLPAFQKYITGGANIFQTNEPVKVIQYLEKEGLR
ncbi:PhoPQ-activated protein PqaA family protein [Parafilimonas sp.]|uniref:PhoPQ-activated protein PqaA family protein n=1 Tax=Parafilimonas sp. TaxID=1969739 RepID=UPI0039E335FA